MGYSLSVKLKNAEEQELIHEFYKANTDMIESLSIAEGRKDSEKYKDLKLDQDLSYAPNSKYLLGYDGPSGRPYYLALLLAWLAVKSNHRDKSKEPFMYYDHEKIKVTQPNKLLIEVDERGIQKFETSMKIYNDEDNALGFILYTVKNFEKYAKEVEQIFNTLEDRWQLLQVNNTTKKSKKM